MTSDTYQQQQKCHQNQLHRGRRRRKTTTTGGGSRSASTVTALCLCLHVLIVSPHRCWADVPVQEYYLPLAEDHLLDSMELVNTESASPVTSMTAITVSAPNTIIYVDHWEDGYEADTISPTSADTEIWGDRNASNGCSPNAPDPCTDADDVLTPGTAIVIQNAVPVPRDATYRSGGKFVMDGGDLIASTFPIAITRGGYPTGPGSLLGGAVEVVNTDSWGTTFIWPGATDLVTLETDAGNAAMDSFELTDVFIMAKEDGTEVMTPDLIDAVTPPDGVLVVGNDIATSYILNAGESVRFEGIKLTDREVTADKPVQAALITGDKGSRYEMRWYSLVPVEQWSESYYTPVGSIDTRVYFTAETAMTINYDNINGTNQGSFDIPAGGIAQFDLANGSGFKFHSQNAGDKFFGITQTDISDGGSASDWGHPLIPGDIMTSQVLLGLAYACTDNTCESDKYYSHVWLTAVDDANIHIDYDANGIPDEIVTVAALQSIHIEDTNDKDMTGATIWATKTDGSGDGVDIASTKGGRLLAADEPVFLQEADAGATFTPTSAPAPAYVAAAPSINNTVCKTVNMTATQSIEIRTFMFYVETNECITVSVLYKGEGDTNWTPLCAEHDVVGQYPNATIVDHTYCAMVPLLDGETVQFRVQTSPSTTGCAEGDGSVTPIYQPLELMYTYSQMECT